MSSIDAVVKGETRRMVVVRIKRCIVDVWVAFGEKVLLVKVSRNSENGCDTDCERASRFILLGSK